VTEPEPKLVPVGSPWWHALRFTDPELRPGVNALVALRGELLDAALAQRDPAIARMRLAWWREESARIANDDARHPVGIALTALPPSARPEAEYLQEMIEGAEMDLDGERPADEGQLMLYLHRSSGVLHELIAQVCGVSDPGSERNVRRYAQRLGQGLRLAEVGRDLFADARSGRCYLPQVWLDAHSVTFRDIESGQATDGVRSLTRTAVQRAGELIGEAVGHLPVEERPRQRTGLVLLALYKPLLTQLERTGVPTREPPATRGLGDLFRAWNAARRAQGRRL
jgi:phytoene synthase